MTRTAVFSARAYDRRFLDEAMARHADAERSELVHVEATLGPDTAVLARDCDAVCVFVNDRLDAPTLAAHTAALVAHPAWQALYTQLTQSIQAAEAAAVARPPSPA